jgi:hypothetical protein
MRNQKSNQHAAHLTFYARFAMLGTPTDEAAVSFCDLEGDLSSFKSTLWAWLRHASISCAEGKATNFTLAGILWPAKSIQANSAMWFRFGGTDYES